MTDRFVSITTYSISIILLSYYYYYYYYHYLLLESFSHQFYLMVFHWSLSDSKSPQVSRTLLNNVVVLMVSTRPLISESSCRFSNLLVTVPKAPIIIGIIVTFMFHSFFQFPGKFKVLILLFTFFQFYSVTNI